jgi:hypothetical protein
MRLPRMTTRRWIIAAAVTAFVTWGEQSRRRWVLYRSRYECFRYAEATYRDCDDEVLAYCGMSPPNEESRRAWAAGKQARRDESLRVAEYYARKKRKWARAMLRPWEVAPDDPPAPDM